MGYSITGDGGLAVEYPEPEALHIWVHRPGGEVVVVLSGALELDGLDDFQDSIFAIDSERLVLDVRRIAFMNSTGIAALLWARQRVVATGGTIRFLGPWRPNVSRILELTGVTDLLRADEG